MTRYRMPIIVFMILLCSSALPALAKKAPQQEALTAVAAASNGHDSVQISGTAPAGATIWLHVTGWISSDLPEIPLGTNDGYEHVTADLSGHYATSVSLATDNWEGSIVQIDASVPDQHLHASTIFHIGKTSPNIHSRNDIVSDH